MKTVLLNWSGARYDWFSYLNNIFKVKLEELGFEPIIIEVPQSDDKVPDFLKLIKDYKTKVVFSHSGIGADVHIPIQNGLSVNFFETNNIIIFILHGDHPWHNIKAHSLDVENCLHIYPSKVFYDAANIFCPKKYAKNVYIPFPLLADEKKIDKRQGEFFVLIKDYFSDEHFLKKNSDRFNVLFYYEKIKKETIVRLNKESYFEHIKFIFEFTKKFQLDKIFDKETLVSFYAHVDFYLRTLKAELICNKIEFPLHVYGSGWTDFAPQNKKIKFFPGKKLKQSQELFYSEFGIIDISPTDGLHDRSQRALINETLFMTYSNKNSFPVGKPSAIESLIYNFVDNNLNERCEFVLNNQKEVIESVKYLKKCWLNERSWKKFLQNLLSLIDKNKS